MPSGPSDVRKSARYRRSWLWMARNVDEVLRALERRGETLGDAG
jgi:hypothetical protein